jgi:hypothetical protein
LDFVIPNAGNLPKTMGNFYEWLGGVNKVTSNLSQDLETVAWGTEYTGTFKTIYGLDARVQEVKTGDSYKEFNAVFSRKSALLDPLFRGHGTPIQQLGRRFTCSGAVA